MRLPTDSSPPSAPPNFWRSLEERAQTPEFQQAVANEFPGGATLWPEELDRRQFLRLMGASFALAGLSGCYRRNASQIVPYVTAPETGVPGVPRFYATAVPLDGFARGVVVETHEGRPTKIEGNPDHPDSLGATDAITQAAILTLYDPDRSAVPMHQGQPSDWAAFDADWTGRHVQLRETGGKGLAILVEPTSSPTVLRQLGRVLAAFPQARWYQHSALASYARDGIQADYDFAAADVILSLGSDCLFRHPAALRYSRAFSSRRRTEHGTIHANRFYCVEATPTVTGAQADFRLPASPARTRTLLTRLSALLGHAPAGAADGVSEAEEAFLVSLAADLQAYAPKVLCLAGEEQSIEVQAWAAALNRSLGAEGVTVHEIAPVRSDPETTSDGALAVLAEAIARGEVSCLFVLGSNPVYTGPADVAFRERLKQVAWSAHLGLYRNETGEACTWHLPESHFLEAWGDLRSFGGVATILQPMIEPLHPSRGVAALLHGVASSEARSDYDLVRETWQGDRADPGFEGDWHRWLNAGIVGEPARAPVRPAAARGTSLPELAAADPGLTLLLYPDATIGDGRWANHAWLQELPKPLTHLVWDNALLIAPALAAEKRLQNGDLVRLGAAGRSLEAAVWIMPGQAPDVVALSLGYGRTAAGSLGTGRGFNAFRLRTTNARWELGGVSLEKTGRTYTLVATQHHFAMEGRDLVRVVSPAQLRLPAAEPRTSLFEPWKSDRYAWGMSIDLSTCLGCNACVVACQAENNIPVVGKDQVSRGREMHWIRVDQYFEGGADNPHILHQPVPCMHCENAPCELVCPVAATVHSSEGLNEMVYNRCVGTRYCSNNCPYKVRRFNFLDYRAEPTSPVNLQKNPDVTVRARGVMEKCTYCVQRINAARITAEKEDRTIRDGEIKTACQQACPVEAIVFGNILDPASGVARKKREPQSYSLLETQNTRPRTTYLAKVRQPEGANRT